MGISVAVYARDPISREGVISQLQRHPAVRVVDAAAARWGDVAVLLAESPGEFEAGWLRRLVRDDGMRVVLVASTMREAELFDVVECGVGNVLWRREATGPQMLRAVRAAARGESGLPPDLVERLSSRMGALRRGPAGGPSVLTQREVDVLRLVAEGMSSEEMAAKLSYSERTVKNVLQRLMSRLDLRNRAHAVAYALREGYMS